LKGPGACCFVARRFLVFLLVAIPFAGCAAPAAAPVSTISKIPALEGAKFDTTGPYSQVLEKGPFTLLPLEKVSLASFDGTKIAAALWRPDTAEKVPVILMISPYFSTGLYQADSRSKQVFLESLGSHGYAYAKVAVRGTSYSGGCMQSMGSVEQRDMDSIVTYFGEQPWSSGSVAVIGKSYVGTTPWAAAEFGNPHLKTIVPVSGVTDWWQLGFRNGTREPRTPIHMQLYWGQYGVADQVLTAADGNEDIAGVRENVCEEAVWTNVAGPYSVATGDPGPARIGEYWSSRNLQPKVRQNYKGSIFLVHGLRDWNVNIDMAVPFVDDLQRGGTEVKWLLGQWQHDWPDDSVAGKNERWDFTEQLLRWFDVHLKGLAHDTGARVDVEDSRGLWRTEATTWPPPDANWTRWNLGKDTLSRAGTTTGSAIATNPAATVEGRACAAATGAPLPDAVPDTEWRFSMGRLDQEFRYAGAARLHVTVVPTEPRGGILYAELLDVAADRTVSRLAHGGMNLRYYAGGSSPQTITPGQRIVAMMELYPADVVVPAGHELLLRMIPDGNLQPCAVAKEGADIQRPFIPGPSVGPLTLYWGGDASTLELPVIQRQVGDGHYPGQPST
jgi:predicted acyl esterase